MKRVIANHDILAMSNVRGKYVQNPGVLPFSFYFSSGSGVTHSIRVKPVFNPDKLKSSLVGTLKLSDDWAYTPGINDQDIAAKQINKMKAFFRKYLVLFCAVWDEQMQDAVLSDYFQGRASFHDVLEDLDFYMTSRKTAKL